MLVPQLYLNVLERAFGAILIVVRAPIVVDHGQFPFHLYRQWRDHVAGYQEGGQVE